MFTLKLYRNGPLPPDGKTVIIEAAGLWVTECGDGVRRIQPFTKKVGVMDEDGGYEFYVGGRVDLNTANTVSEDAAPSAITHDNYYSWGVLENAQGKTTEMFR